MGREIPKAYEPNEIEQRWAQKWVEDELFRVDAKATGPVFSIVIPPPNVTGSIHIGHMLEHTQIDTLVRWHRMRGHNTLWLPGMDHAGIATQVVVERLLAAEGISRKQMGREEFERRVWEWKVSSGGTIKKQMIRLGASCDWSRERFTLDPPLYRAVLEAFLRLYREGLIYRGRYMVNWCPRCMTALSDLETVHQERQGHLWYIRYPVIGSNESITVATTRPETMLGDTAVAVHPDDERYRYLIGKKVLLPLMEREIPVIADAIVDREFGTGVVKVTPAHDPNDFEMGKRHNLPEVDILNDDGTLTPVAGAYAGMDRFAARKEVVAAFTAQGLLEKTVNHTHSIGVCDRCKTVVEPRVSTQWFCKMKPLAEEAIQVVRDGLIPVVPENQKTIYLNWMENIRDWCISRQLWWGHRIPIWHCADCKGMTPATDSRVEIVNGRAQAAGVPQKCSACGSVKIAQDPDVLDTWFSSGLWPFSTLGWPDETQDLRAFYPTSLLISGYDILFFWDARMIMMGLHLLKDRHREQKERIPFRALYLHALVRDPEGLKMSKTRGNVVDPLEVIEKYGTDALRFTLAIMAAPGTDIALSEDRILSYRAFANKIWNAARFIIVNLGKAQMRELCIGESPEQKDAKGASQLDKSRLQIEDHWISGMLAQTANTVNEALSEYRFHEAAHAVYHFIWGDVCDWYLECAKLRIVSDDSKESILCWRHLLAIFQDSLKLLHPFMPFLTEELWHEVFLHPVNGSIAFELYPKGKSGFHLPLAVWEFKNLQEFVTSIRQLKSELKIEPRQKVACVYRVTDQTLHNIILPNIEKLRRLAKVAELTAFEGQIDGSKYLVRSAQGFDIGLPRSSSPHIVIDVSSELSKLREDIRLVSEAIEKNRRLLNNSAFRSKAPSDVVTGIEFKLHEREVEHKKLCDRLAQLEHSTDASA